MREMLVFIVAWIWVAIHCVTAEVPVPVIESVTETLLGYSIHWRLEPPVAVKQTNITYQGSDGTSESLLVSGNQVEALLQLIRPCINYTVVVTVTDAEDNMADSEPYRFTGPQLPTPEPPTNLRVSEQSTGRLLHWDLPANTTYIRNYNIIGESGDQEPIVMKATYDQREQLLYDFPNTQSFDVWMTAENLCGVSNESSEIHVAKIEAPATPLIRNVLPGRREIIVQYTKNTQGSEVYEFRIQYLKSNGEEVIIPKEADTTEVRLTDGIVDCYKYVIKVYALNAGGPSKPAIVTAFAKSEESPTKPQNPHLSEDENSIHVSWTVSNLDKTLAHEVNYFADGETPNSVVVSGSNTGVRLDGLRGCLNYAVRIRSQWKCSWSEYSDPVYIKVKPHEIPQKPKNFMAQKIGSSSCSLAWENGGPEELRTQNELAVAEESQPARYYWLGPFEERYTQANMQSNKNYKIMLWARNDCGWSDAAEVNLKLERNRCAITVS